MHVPFEAVRLHISGPDLYESLGRGEVGRYSSHTISPRSRLTKAVLDIGFKEYDYTWPMSQHRVAERL